MQHRLTAGRLTNYVADYGSDVETHSNLNTATARVIKVNGGFGCSYDRICSKCSNSTNVVLFLVLDKIADSLFGLRDVTTWQ
mgnify:CR=1 FL=1